MVLIIISPINLGLNIALVHYTSLGLLGSPVALSIVYWLAFLFLVIFTCFSPVHRRNGTWGGFRVFDVFHFKSCVTFLQLALPGKQPSLRPSNQLINIIAGRYSDGRY